MPPSRFRNHKAMIDSEKLQDLKSQIKELEQKKTTLTDAAEIKAVNKQINALQEEFGRLREEIKCQKSYEKSVEREFVHLEIGDD
jgi:chromosome segregation ATPase